MTDVEMDSLQTETRPSPSAMNLTLFCCLVGSNTPFAVDISSSLTVSHLQKMIKQEKQNELKEIDADKLALFKVAVPEDEHDLEKRVKDTVTGMRPLKSTKKLSKLFLDEPLEETIHIAVKLPHDLQHRRVKSDSEYGAAGAVIEQLRQSMNTEFLGSAASALFDYLVGCRKQYEEGGFYAKFTSVCNSSGTGKTKTILQLRNYQIALVYINMRDFTDDRNFPPRDHEIANLFDPSLTAGDYYRSCILIFRALFQQLLVEFTQRLPDCLPHSRAHFIEMVSKWNEDFTPVALDTRKREGFFGAVKNLYDQMAASQSQTSSIVKLLYDDYRKLCYFLQPLCSNDRNVPIVVLALDETQELTKWKGGSEDGYSPAHILGRVIRDYSTSLGVMSDVWVLFSSTNSKVTHFAAPAAIHASQRVTNEGLLLFPPFSALHWDILAPPMEDLSVLSVGSYRDVISFGRPLWESVASIFPTAKDMSRYALTKLTYRNRTDEIISNEALLAVLSQRFALGVVNGSRESVPFVSKSIASYMRILVSTTEDRIWQETAYPSEPVLSHAAAEFMYKDEESLATLLKCLATKILSGLIEAGELGELIGRLLLLISRDFAAILAYNIENSSRLPDDLLPLIHRSTPFPCSDTDFFPYLRPVPLLDVLNILFGPQWLSPALKNSETEEQRVIKSTFGRAYVSWSHWAVFTENIGPLPGNITSENWLKTFFLRGTAIQCCHNQPLIDGVIPIMHLDHNGNYVGMSSWLLQYKNRTTVTSGALYSVDVHNASIDLDTKLPYVVTCFHFGVSKEVSAHATMLTRTTTSSSQALQIEVQGLSEEVFPVLTARGISNCIIALRDVTKSVQFPKESPNQAVTCASMRYALSTKHIKWGIGRKRKIEENL